MYALSNEVYVRRSVQGAVFNTAPQGHFMKLMTFTGCAAQRNKPVNVI